LARKLFVSYSHADEPERPRDGEVQWLTFVLGYLRAALRGAEVEIFTDRGLAGGADWEPEIERHLRACDAFVLLASPNSLNSTYVVEKEIAVVRAREKAGDGPLFLPILMAPTPEAALDLVRGKNWRPRGDKTLWEYPPPERARLMTQGADELAREVKGRGRKPPVIADSDALKHWLQGQPREVAVAIAARAALRVFPLFETGSKRLRSDSDEMFVSLRAIAFAYAAAKHPSVPSQ
jgi:hypothetical protein